MPPTQGRVFVSTLSITRGKRVQAGKFSPRGEKGMTAQRAAVAKDWAAKEYGAAREWATPRVEAAVGRTRDVARDDLAPKIAAAVLAATTVSEPVLAEARRRGGLAMAALRGQEIVVKKRRRWLRRLLFSAFTGAAVAATMSRLQRKRLEDELSADASPTAGDLTSSRNAPPPADAAGASPSEAVADLVDEQPDRELAPETPVAPVPPVADARRTDIPKY
jgi:hypothetical protein